ELAGVALPAPVSPPVGHDRAAQADAQEEVEVAGELGPHAEVALAQGGGGGVVLEEHRRVQAAGQLRPDRHVLPAGEAFRVDDVVHDAVGDAQWAGEADPYAPQPALVHAARELLDDPDDEVESLFG